MWCLILYLYLVVVISVLSSTVYMQIMFSLCPELPEGTRGDPGGGDGYLPRTQEQLSAGIW